MSTIVDVIDLGPYDVIKAWNWTLFTFDFFASSNLSKIEIRSGAPSTGAGIFVDRVSLTEIC